MNNEMQKKINKNNRKRGGSFEKRVADYLGFDVVPYSGSNARFGYGDVRSDKWLIECKNITPNDNDKICIKQLWIEKNRQRSDYVNKSSCIAWMQAGKPNKYILMEYEDFANTGLKPDYSYEIICKSYNTKNLLFHKDAYYLKDICSGIVVEIILNDVSYFMMSIEKFKEII